MIEVRGSFLPSGRFCVESKLTSGLLVHARLSQRLELYVLNMFQRASPKCVDMFENAEQRPLVNLF